MGRAMLLMTTGLAVIYGIIQIGVSNRQQAIPANLTEYYTDVQAENISASLIEVAIEQIREDQDWVGSFEFDDFMGASGFVRAYDRTSTQVPDSTNQGVWDEYKVVLYSEITYNDKTLKKEVLLQRDSFSRYSYFTDFEPNNIYFFSNDELSGPVHTNGTMNIAGDPTFNGMVTSPNDWRGRTGMTNEPNFNGGSNFSSPEKTPPTTYELNQLRTAAAEDGLKYDSDINLEFKSNGTVDVTEETGGWVRDRWGRWQYVTSSVTNTHDISTFNGVISTSKDVKVKGVVKGQVTIHSEGNIEIMGDLVYSSNPLDDEYSTDILGMVSEGNVLVDDDAHRDNGYSDLNIHASIMALDKSFSVEDYGSGSPRGSLNILGGLIQDTRGAVGTFSGGSIRSGFSKDYRYDERLLQMIPPAFPRERYFSVVYWRDRTH